MMVLIIFLGHGTEVEHRWSSDDYLSMKIVSQYFEATEHDRNDIYNVFKNNNGLY